MTRDELLAPGAGLELLLDIRLDGIATGYATARTIDGGER